MKRLVKRGDATKIEDFYSSETDIKKLMTESFIFDDKGIPDRILSAIDAGRKIYIRTDYDADGVTSAAIWEFTLQMVSIARGKDPSLVTVYSPRRFSDGYVCTPDQVPNMPNGSLFMTVDNGITAFDAFEKATDKEYERIIVDHHLPRMDGADARIPKCDAFIDPHKEFLEAEARGEKCTAYSFRDYCAAGLSAKLCEIIINTVNLPDKERLLGIIYSFALIGTYADVMPILGENRVIAQKGINAILEGNITDGLKALLEKSSISVEDIPKGVAPAAILNDEVFGFDVGPRINASSRMENDGAELARITITTDKNEDRATTLAEELNRLNEQRKAAQKEEINKIHAQIADKNLAGQIPLVVYLPDAKQGIIGLDAGNLREEYGIPVIVLNGQPAEGETDCLCRGSARAPEGVHITALLQSVDEFLAEYGGHELAAGLAVWKRNIEPFREAIVAAASACGIKPVEKDNYYYDIDVQPFALMGTINYCYNVLAPFGEGYQLPVVRIPVKIKEVRKIGSEQQHLRVKDVYDNTYLAFNACRNGIPNGLEPGKTVYAAGRPMLNLWNGHTYPQLRVECFADQDGRVLEKTAADDDARPANAEVVR